MVKNMHIICRQKATNCLRVLGYFVGLALKGLDSIKAVATEAINRVRIIANETNNYQQNKAAKLDYYYYLLH